MVERRVLNGWSIRWDPARAADARARGLWIDETLAEIAARKATDEPDTLLLVDGERRIDAATLYAEASAVAQALLARGFRPGDTLSFMLPNWHEAAVIYLAATLTGMVAHPIVPALRDHEVGFQLRDSCSRMIFVPAAFRRFDYPAMMQRVTADLPNPVEVVVLRGDAAGFTGYSSLLAHRGTAPLPEVEPDSVKMLMYTSGTTGRPKGVLHSHNSLNALVTQLHDHWRAGTGDAFFVPSPISHIGGSIYAFEMPLLFGTRAVLQDSWDAPAAVAIMAREGCTHMAGATPFLEALLAAARAADTTLPALKVFIGGGADHQRASAILAFPDDWMILDQADRGDALAIRFGDGIGDRAQAGGNAMHRAQPVDRRLIRFGKMGIGRVSTGKFGLPTGCCDMPRGEQGRLGRRHVDGDPVHVPEEGAEHIFGLAVDLAVEGDLIDRFFGGPVGDGRAGDVDPRAEQIREGELLGIGEMRARKDQHGARVEHLAAAPGGLLGEQAGAIDVDDRADVRLHGLEFDAHGAPLQDHSFGEHR